MPNYNSKKVAEVVQDINSRYFLPAIQRDLVWDKDKIKKLFDSVVEDYPIGSVIFWEVSDVSSEQILYKFVQHKSYRQTYYTLKGAIEEKESTVVTYDDIQHRNTPLSSYEKEKLEGDDVTLVLDGQQRLSAFYIGLTGTITEWTNSRWRPGRRLFINLVGRKEDPASEENRHEWAFRDFDDDFKITKNKVWMRVGKYMDYYEEFKESRKVNRKLIEEVRERIDGTRFDDFEKENQIHEEIREVGDALMRHEKVMVHKEETDDDSRILEVFLRTNVQPETLSEAEIVLSILTNKWSKEGVNAKEEINQFCDELARNEKYKGPFELDIEKVVRLLAVVQDIQLQYNLSSFDNNDLQELKEAWENEEIQNAIKDAMDFLMKLGFDSSVLSSQDSVFEPLVYYFYKTDDPETRIGTKNCRKMQYWISSALLSSRYSQRAGPIANDMRTAMREELEDSDEFPLKNIRKVFMDKGREYTLDLREKDMRGAFRDVDDMRSSGPAYAIFSLMYFPVTQSNKEYQQDHLHPSSRLKVEYLLDEGVKMIEAERINENKDKLGNFELLSPEKNSEKGDRPLKEWVNEQDDNYKKKHFIPEDVSLDEKDYRNFIEAREELIIEHLRERFNQMFTENPNEGYIDEQKFSSIFED